MQNKKQKIQNVSKNKFYTNTFYVSTSVLLKNYEYKKKKKKMLI